MRRVSILAWTLMVGLVLSLAGAARAQPLAEVVPEDALVYIAWRGAKNLGPGYEGSHLKAVLEASNIPALFEEFLPKALARLGNDGPRDFRGLGEVAPLLSAAWKYPTAFYFGGVDFPKNEPPLLRMALFCRAGDEAPALAKTLNQILEQSGAPIQATVKDGLVTVALGNLVLGKTIAGNARFTKALEQAGKDPVLVAYVNAEGLLEIIDNGIKNTGNRREREEWPKIREGLGLDGLKRVILTCGFEDKAWATRVFLDAPAPAEGGKRRGLLAFLDAAPVTATAVKLIPKNAAWGMAFRLDLSKVVDDVTRIVREFDPRAVEQFNEAMVELKKEIGFHVQTDLLAALGDEWVIYTDSATAGNGMFGIVVVNRLRAPEIFSNSILKLQNYIMAKIKAEAGRGRGPNIAMRVVKAGDNVVHYLAVPVVAPAWTVQNEMWIAGLYPQVVVAAAQDLKARGFNGPSILDNAECTALRARLNKGATASFFAYADLPQTAGEGYQTTLLLSQLALGMGDLFGLESPSMVIPPLPALRPHLTPAGVVAWSDKDGWHFAGSTPFPGAELMASQQSLMVSVQAMAVGIMLPALGAARTTARRMQSSTQARGLHQACVIFAAGNNGKFPPDLGVLYDKGFFTIDYTISPMDSKPIPADWEKLGVQEKRDWINANTSFCYVTGLTDDNDSRRVAVFHKAIPGLSVIPVAFNDNHVEVLPLERADELIKKQTGRTLAEWSKAKNPGAGGK